MVKKNSNVPILWYNHFYAEKGPLEKISPYILMNQFKIKTFSPMTRILACTASVPLLLLLFFAATTYRPII